MYYTLPTKPQNADAMVSFYVDHLKPKQRMT